jgi:hypothetical protein
MPQRTGCLVIQFSDSQAALRNDSPLPNTRNSKGDPPAERGSCSPWFWVRELKQRTQGLARAPRWVRLMQLYGIRPDARRRETTVFPNTGLVDSRVTVGEWRGKRVSQFLGCKDLPGYRSTLPRDTDLSPVFWRSVGECTKGFDSVNTLVSNFKSFLILSHNRWRVPLRDP